MSDILKVEGVTKEFLSREGTLVRAIDGISFDLSEGGITCIVGPTGSGKSTLLRLIAGLEKPDEGTLSVYGNAPEPGRTPLAYLTQRHTLLPWMKVIDNISLPYTVKGLSVPNDTIKSIVSVLGLEGAEHLYPHELSGGMQQRAALGRLLATDAPLWLLDEPFSHLDERTQHMLQRLILSIAGYNKTTVLFVTHSIDEAVFVADRILVLSSRPGRICSSYVPGLEHPRDRLSPDYSMAMDDIRRSIESALYV